MGLLGVARANTAVGVSPEKNPTTSTEPQIHDIQAKHQKRNMQKGSEGTYCESRGGACMSMEQSRLPENTK
jgi:hypothetical protein